MDYVFTFLEGIASFISPCILPMLPIYISYFLGKEEKSAKNAVINSCGFVLGLTIVFLTLSIFASQFGTIISENMRYIKIVFGILIIVLGLNYMEVFNLKILNKTKGINTKFKSLNFIKSLAFGMLFSVTWTPCIGTFLSSALLLIASQQDMVKGIILMLLYSIGLGIPFVLTAIFMEKLREIFNFIKKNYNYIKKISGVILIIMGIYMMFF